MDGSKNVDKLLSVSCDVFCYGTDEIEIHWVGKILYHNSVLVIVLFIHIPRKKILCLPWWPLLQGRSGCESWSNISGLAGISAIPEVLCEVPPSHSGIPSLLQFPRNCSFPVAPLLLRVFAGSKENRTDPCGGPCRGWSCGRTSMVVPGMYPWDEVSSVLQRGPDSNFWVRDVGSRTTGPTNKCFPCSLQSLPRDNTAGMSLEQLHSDEKDEDHAHTLALLHSSLDPLH